MYGLRVSGVAWPKSWFLGGSVFFCGIHFSLLCYVLGSFDHIAYTLAKHIKFEQAESARLAGTGCVILTDDFILYVCSGIVTVRRNPLFHFKLPGIYV